MSNTTRPPLISGLAEIATGYRILLCDVWGVVHNGVAAYPGAGKALAEFRRQGGIVLLITNAPRPKAEVVKQLDRYGLERGAYDDVMTSGEASRENLAERPGTRVFHLGPERDLPLYTGLDLVLTGDEQADLICCTGLFDDETETPDDYDERMTGWIARGLPMLCVNPDRVVERGPRLIWCAGAMADRYTAIGGETIVVGKPHPPIYVTAMRRLGEIAGRTVAKSEVLAIGDGPETDIRGAVQAGIDVLFVTAGINAETFGHRDRPNPEAVHAFIERHRLAARAYTPQLVW